MDKKGFSESFRQEMLQDSKNIKESNKKALWGELLSYLHGIIELVKNIVFFLSYFRPSFENILWTYILLSIIGFSIFLAMIFNFIKVEKILNGGTLTDSNKLFLFSYALYGLYSNLFLNISFAIRMV